MLSGKREFSPKRKLHFNAQVQGILTMFPEAPCYGTSATARIQLLLTLSYKPRKADLVGCLTPSFPTLQPRFFPFLKWVRELRHTGNRTNLSNLTFGHELP